MGQTATNRGILKIRVTKAIEEKVIVVDDNSPDQNTASSTLVKGAMKYAFQPLRFINIPLCRTCGYI